VLAAVEKQTRVRREVERRLLQSIKLQIHVRLLTKNSARRKEKVLAAIHRTEFPTRGHLEIIFRDACTNASASACVPIVMRK
jgi:hypothetical protein